MVRLGVVVAARGTTCGGGRALVVLLGVVGAAVGIIKYLIYKKKTFLLFLFCAFFKTRNY